jgi:hypothetical protein
MNKETLLLRQVHPNFFQDNEISSQAFIPFPKDHGKLSVYDGDELSAEDSYIHYTVMQGLKSVGVWAVNGMEVESIGLAYLSDPVDKNPHHAVIDFDARSDKEGRKLAKRLKKFAVDRGCQYIAV